MRNSKGDSAMFAELFAQLLEERVKKETGHVSWVDDMDACGAISAGNGIEVPFYCESIGFETCKNLSEREEVEFEISYEGSIIEALNIHKISQGN
jgi:cold shock CspA family protein